MKKREVNHAGNTITVENRFDGERLYVNGALQDELLGFASRARLWGSLHTGETVKVSLGGTFRAHCRIFIDNKLVLSE